MAQPHAAIRLEPLAANHRSLLARWLDDEDSRRGVGGMLPLNRWLHFVLEDDNHYNWLAWRSGYPVGEVGVEVTGRQAAIGILVDPEHRRQGMGTAMLRALVVQPELARVRNFRAWVHETNEASLRLFARVGFRPMRPTTDEDGYLELGWSPSLALRSRRSSTDHREGGPLP